jgi:hypothetical protein
VGNESNFTKNYKKLQKMSELRYLSLKNCACCSVRLDRTVKRNIKRVNESNLHLMNTVKPIILNNKRKTTDDVQINVGDLICGACRVYAKKFKTNNSS